MNFFDWINRKTMYFRSGCRTIVLMYHRVIDIKIDPWELAVSPENFEQQMHILKQSGKVISLPSLIERIRSGRKFPPSIVITFDDGYRDNYLHAKPLLEKYDLPATFFISSKNIGKKQEFWWDELAYLLLENPSLPKVLNFKIKDQPFSFHLENEQTLSSEVLKIHANWTAYKKPCTLRSQLYLKLWELFSSLGYQDQQISLNELRKKLQMPVPNNDQNYSLTEDQLIDVATSSLFTIGAHTVSHPRLPNVSKDQQYQEIIKNKKYLESLIDSSINYFAYPSGRYNNDTIEILKQEGF